MSVSIVKGKNFTRRFETGANTLLSAGTPVKMGTNVVVALATGDPEIRTDQFVGITSNASTDTATVAGFVDVIVIIPGETVLRAPATTPANLAAGILGDSVTFDVTTGVYTVDEDEGDDPDVHGLLIVGYDATNGTVDFQVKPEAMNIGSPDATAE